MTQSLPLHRTGNIAALHTVPLEELHPGRGIVKQVSYDHRRSLGAARRGNIHHIACLQMDGRSGLLFLGLRQKVDPTHRADGCQGLASESHRHDAV